MRYFRMKPGKNSKRIGMEQCSRFKVCTGAEKSIGICRFWIGETPSRICFMNCFLLAEKMEACTLTDHVTSLVQKNNGESGNWNFIFPKCCSARFRPLDWRGRVYFLSFRNGIHLFCPVNAFGFCCHYFPGPVTRISFCFLAFCRDYVSPGKTVGKFPLWNHIFCPRRAWSAARLCGHNLRPAPVSARRYCLPGCIIRVLSGWFHVSSNDNSIAVLFS